MDSARRELSSPTRSATRRSNRHGPRGRTIAVLSSLALGAAACSSVSASSTGDSVDDAKLIQVPDAYTSVVVRSLSAPTFPFLGTDGKYHVAYDLELTNASRVPATIDKLDVVSAAASKRVIVSYSGTAFVDATCDYGIFTGEVDSAVSAQLPTIAQGGDIDAAIQAINAQAAQQTQ